MSKSDALDLYAKVEDLLGVKEATPDLYTYYFRFLQTIDFDSLLDVGCGSGDFLLQAKSAFAPSKLLGIDLSPSMVEQTRGRGLDALCIDLCELEDSFDVVTAVFDMLNYLDKHAIKHFLACLQERVKPGGYFLCDINTRYGFEEVAVGSFIVDDDDRFLTIDSEFDEGVYHSAFTLFEKNADACFDKSTGVIMQFYHTIEELAASLDQMDLTEQSNVTLYAEEADKQFLVFRKHAG